MTITLIGPLALHMYLPIMPTIQQAFGVSTFMTTVSFSMVLFVMAFGTMIYGSASDRLGRKPVLMAGLLLFAAGSIVCTVAGNFAVLLIGRFLQALAAGCGVVLARAIARDVYGAERLTQAIAYITAAYVLGPTLAPPIGGFISDALGWNAVFLFATLVSIVVIVLAGLVIPETHRERRRGRHVASLLADYGRLFRNPEFVGYALNPALTAGSFFAMSTYASYLVRDHYGLSAGDYGAYFVLLSFGFMTGNFISGRLGNRMETEYMVVLGALTNIITVEVLTAGVMFLPAEPLALFLPAMFTGMAQGLSLPYAQAAAINAEPDLAGTASGSVMSLHFLAAAFTSLLVSTVYDGTFFPMIDAMFVLSLMTLACALFANRHRRRRLAVASSGR